MRHILLLLLVLAIGGVLRAQSPEEAWLDGTLVSKADKTPLVNAFVVLRTADGADTPFSALTDEKGYFLLKATTGTYRLAATFVQQTIILRPSLELPAGQLQLGTLPVELTRELEAVVVEGKTPLVRYEGSTLIFGEAAFAKARGGSVLDGLKLIPGLQIEGANKLKLYGISELVVYIDGRPQRMSQDEVIALLQGMSVSEIAQVELIREPGVEYSGVTTPILNIKRKTRADEGVKGFTSLVGTYHQLFSEQLSTRVNLNYGRSRSYVSYTLGNKRYRETTTLSSGVVDDLRVDPTSLPSGRSGYGPHAGQGAFPRGAIPRELCRRASPLLAGDEQSYEVVEPLRHALPYLPSQSLEPTDDRRGLTWELRPAPRSGGLWM